jgi:RHS repeat-associated protein
MHVRRDGGVEDEFVLYFAGRPVGILTRTGVTSSLKFLSADHLGTPILATSGSGSALWSGGFEPFGADWSGAQGVGMFLRFPGQWDDYIWSSSTNDTLYYNLYRWYWPSAGRYVRVDPFDLGPALSASVIDKIEGTKEHRALAGLLSPKLLSPYGYAAADPIGSFDPNGLIVQCALPWVIPPLTAAAEWTVVVISAGLAAIGVVELLDKISPCEDCDQKKCPPCRLADGTLVPIGMIAYRWDFLPDDVVQHGIQGSHLNLYRANQNPNNCQCFWQAIGAVKPPPQPNWIPISSFAR